MQLANLSFPVVIKPNDSGSSVGVKICNNIRDVENYFQNGLEKKILIEEFINGIELTCGVLETRESRFIKLPPVEIRPKLGKFFNYNSKYKADGSDELCPQYLS